ncbi:hypothetical protein LSAT2_020946 [Lamellibrachia satsuma]|nr:hypothetical protein LSAT2_020946 [Lamellibrachia satsuma]
MKNVELLTSDRGSARMAWSATRNQLPLIHAASLFHRWLPWTYCWVVLLLSTGRWCPFQSGVWKAISVYVENMAKSSPSCLLYLIYDVVDADTFRDFLSTAITHVMFANTTLWLKGGPGSGGSIISSGYPDYISRGNFSRMLRPPSLLLIACPECRISLIFSVMSLPYCQHADSYFTKIQHYCYSSVG